MARVGRARTVNGTAEGTRHNPCNARGEPHQFVDDDEGAWRGSVQNCGHFPVHPESEGERED